MSLVSLLSLGFSHILTMMALPSGLTVFPFRGHHVQPLGLMLAAQLVVSPPLAPLTSLMCGGFLVGFSLPRSDGTQGFCASAFLL